MPITRPFWWSWKNNRSLVFCLGISSTSICVCFSLLITKTVIVFYISTRMVPGISEKYPVEIYHTSTTGLFIICEPVGNDSISKIKRVKIQEELTSVISHLEKTDPQSVNYRNVTIGEVILLL